MRGDRQALYRDGNFGFATRLAPSHAQMYSGFQMSTHSFENKKINPNEGFEFSFSLRQNENRYIVAPAGINNLIALLALLEIIWRSCYGYLCSCHHRSQV